MRRRVLPPVETLAPFLTASAICASTFSNAFRFDQRPDHRTRLEPVGDLHRAGGLGKALGKGVIDAVLHQDAVGAETQVWPAFLYFEAIAPLTAISISASSKTMNCALPAQLNEPDAVSNHP